jgi:hypothetical protein
MPLEGPGILVAAALSTQLNHSTHDLIDLAHQICFEPSWPPTKEKDRVLAGAKGSSNPSPQASQAACAVGRPKSSADFLTGVSISRVVDTPLLLCVRGA